MVIKNACLQRRQRVDVLHIGHATRHGCDDLIDLRLGQVGQWQQLRRNALAVLADQVGGHHDLGATAHGCGQCSQGRLAEQYAYIGAEAQLAHTPGQADRQQRVTAEFEEMVVTTDLLDAQQVLPDNRDLLLDFALWGFVATADQRVTVGCRQRLAIQLAVGRQWHGLEQYINGRNHVFRQLLLQVTAQGFEIDSSVLGRLRVVSHQTFVAGYVFASSDHRFVDRRVFGQRRLDFADFDTQAADLHLKVIAAQVFQCAIGQPATDVAGFVQACLPVFGKRVGDETLGTQVRLIQVTPRHADTANVQLTGHTQWLQLAQGIEYVHLNVGNRAADGHAVARIRRTAFPGSNVDGRFGRAIQVVQFNALELLLETALQRTRQGLATAQHAAQLREVAG
ncbi:hypothetical protein PssB301D_02644 [Pseudomonas syringae pv. syringae str. B301D-R]|nr:hypothetical protein PssB301D_02644 [Pseudomonas syringae pv. syringae str. B301D-R]